MKKLSQYGSFDLDVEEFVRAQLLAEFSEGSSDYNFAACQRPDGSVYGIQSGFQCRKGTPISIKPDEGMPVLYKKAIAAGLKRTEVQAIADQVREKFGVKQIRKGPSLEAALTEIKKRLGEEVETAPASAPNKTSPKSEPQSEKSTPAPSARSESPVSAKTSKVSDEQVKATFDRAVSNEMRLVEQQKELQAQGKKWNDPEIRDISARIGKAHEAVELMRQTYYATDRDAFLKAAGEQKKLRDQASKLEAEARKMVEKDGLTPFNLPDGHPAKVLQDRATAIRYEANDAVRDRMFAAFYGEPAKITKASSDGGGKVDAAVPTGVPRGGADKDLKDFLEGAEPVMAFNPKGFAKFVKEGEAKNGFEAGTGGVKKDKTGSGRMYYLEGRKSGEETVMGISKDTDAKNRPVYAALEHPDRVRSLQGGSGNQLAQYGGVQVIFNNDVKDRSTFTIGDSLDTASPRGIMASPVRDPANPTSSRTTITDLDYRGGVRSQAITYSTTMDNGYRVPVPYVEAQIHGGLRSSDIREVRYYKGHEIPSATRKALEKQGVKIVELPPQMTDLRVERGNPDYFDIRTIEQSWKK